MYLGLHSEHRTWKGFNYAATDHLHAKGLISDPQGRARSVVFTEEGLRLSRERYQALSGIPE